MILDETEKKKKKDVIFTRVLEIELVTSEELTFL